MRHVLVVGVEGEKDGIRVVKKYSDFTLHYFDISSAKYKTRSNIIDFDIEDYVEQARNYIRSHKIDGIYFNKDLGSLIGAVLCQEFGFVGPTLESAFNCYHKYYTRKLTGPQLSYWLYPLSDPFPRIVSYPFYVKAPYSALGTLGFAIRNQKDLQMVLEKIVVELPKMNKSVNTFLRRYISPVKFAYAFTNAMLVEECISGPQCTIEGYVYNNEVKITVITDTNYYSGTSLIDNFSSPSQFTFYQQSQVMRQAKKDIQKIGLKNSFFNSEYWYVNDKAVLIEINCRAANAFSTLYSSAYNYDVLRSSLLLCVGEDPNVSALQAQAVAGQFNIVTLRTGDSNTIFDYNIPAPSPLNFFFKPHSIIQSLSDFGTVIGQFELAGESYDQIKSIADQYRKKSVLK